MAVPEGRQYVARVQLSYAEMQQAMQGTVEKWAYVELPGGQSRRSPTPVKIKMSAEEDPREATTITATYAVALSPTLLGKYRVVILNEQEVLQAIPILATAEAKQAYVSQDVPPMTLYIYDKDKNQTGEIKRAMVYNFPVEYVARKEIGLRGPPVEARFRLEPLTVSGPE